MGTQFNNKNNYKTKTSCWKKTNKDNRYLIK